MTDPDFAPPGSHAKTTETNGLAIGSLVMGILSWLGLACVGPLGAIVSGHIALGQIRREPMRYAGKGMAVAGLALGYANLALTLLVAGLIGIFLMRGVPPMSAPGSPTAVRTGNGGSIRIQVGPATTPGQNVKVLIGPTAPMSPPPPLQPPATELVPAIPPSPPSK